MCYIIPQRVKAQLCTWVAIAVFHIALHTVALGKLGGVFQKLTPHNQK